MNQRSLFSRLWTGDVSLGVTYWVFGSVVGSALAVAVTAFISQYLWQITTSNYSKEIFGALTVLLVAYQVFIAVAIFRSATKHKVKKPSSPWPIIAKVFVVLGCMATLGRVVDIFDNAPIESLDYHNVVAMMNNGLPKMVDETTRLDAVTYEDKKIIYNYTVMTTPAEGFQDRLAAIVKSKVCESQEASLLLKDIDMVYLYRSLAGSLLDRLIVTSADCVVKH